MIRSRAHPIMILEHLWRFLYLLLIPVARGLAVGLRYGLASWLESAWMDVLMLLAVVALAVARWACITFAHTPEGFSLCSGFLRRRRVLIPQRHIDTLAVTRPFYLRPFRAVRLRIDTKAGGYDKADVVLSISYKAAQALFEEREEFLSGGDFLGRVYRPRGLHIVALSAVLSNSFAGVLFFSTFISQSGRLLGSEFENRIFGTFERFTRVMAFGLPPAAAALAYLMVFGWLFTFLLNLVRHKNFRVRRGAGSLMITGGVFTNRGYSLRVDAINYVDIRQSILTKILGLYSAFLHAVGYGKDKDDMTALIPASTHDDLMLQLELLLPEWKLTARQCRPNAGALFRFLNDAFWPCVLLPLASWLLAWLFPGWADFIRWLGFMSCLPAYLFLTVRIFDFTSSGIGRHGDTYTLRYSRGFYLHTVIMPRDKVASITLRQSVFQKMDNKCDVLINSISERSIRHHIRNIDKTKAIQVLDIDLL